MLSKPFLDKHQAIHRGSPSIPMKKLRLHELNIKKRKTFIQHSLKKQKASTWNWEPEGFWRRVIFRSLAEAMKSEKEITALKVKSHSSIQILDKDFDFIIAALKKLPCLKYLNLSFENVQIPVEGLRRLFQELDAPRSLQRLKLFFRECNNLTDETLSYLRRNRRKLSLIKDLNLDFKDCSQITDIGLGEISQCLKSLSGLRKLKLTFRTCSQITDVGLEKVKEGIKCLPRLESLSIVLGFLPSMTNSGIRHLSQGLNSLNQLKSLLLLCSACKKVTDTSLVALGEDLKKLRALQDLYIRFDQCLITDKGLNAISKNLKKLGRLERVTLNFKWSKNITDKGLEYLGLNLREATHLKEITLDFWVLYEPRIEITDNGLHAVSKNLKEITCLEKFCIHISGNPRITDLGLGYLARNLKECANLKEVTLDCECCEKTTVNGRNKFLDVLKNYAPAKKVNVMFEEDARVKEKTLKIPLWAIVLLCVVFILQVFLFWSKFFEIK